MITLLRVLYPLFSWIFMLFYGWDSVHNQHLVQVLVVFFGLAAFAETYWRLRLKERQPRAKSDLISFGIGLSALVVFPLLVAWKIYAM